MTRYTVAEQVRYALDTAIIENGYNFAGWPFKLIVVDLMDYDFILENSPVDEVLAGVIQYFTIAAP